MRRRELIALLGGIVAWPTASWAQAKKRARLGVLVMSNPEPFLGLLKQGLRERGYVDGQNIQIGVRSAQGKADLLPGLATELVRLKLDALVGWQTPTIHALKQATSEIPIVMMAGDPVATGLVASLARPGGNITGVSGTTAAVGGKTLELIREIPSLGKARGRSRERCRPFHQAFPRADSASRPSHGD